MCCETLHRARNLRTKCKKCNLLSRFIFTENDKFITHVYLINELIQNITEKLESLSSNNP